MTGPKKCFKTSYIAVLTYLFKVQNVVKRSVKSRIHFSTSYRGGGGGCGGAGSERGMYLFVHR